MFDNKLSKVILAGTLAISTLFLISAEAKPINTEIIAQSQQEPTFKQDLDRYGRKAKRVLDRGVGNLKERYTDHILWKAKKCEATQSKTENCQNAIKKARELNK